ncbi:IclR family transcriptional regulator [Amylibacter sp. SFDW26]|uniref:IclR family transcriptional regulator n=1 Tax=Amylibacter sp. SFDW26 TaxID=2652722 RepID=UPI001261F5BA|nr:IclR family transcriptional regulator [Amylibacter sp. SFDW26]KAB7610050.1 IclR family transcriptional regulator [Amylibacter sp. SFDW26]
MTEENRIPTNLRTLLILEIIGRSDHAMTPTEINEQIRLPKQTVHRLVATLEKEGFLAKEVSGKRYRPTRRLRLLGAGLLHASRFHIMRHQVLQEIASQVKETVNFVVPEESGMHYLDRIETDWPFRVQLPVGSNVPFHCTASGKTFLASLSKSARKKFVSGLALEKLTENSHTTHEALLKDLDKCSKRGYALDDEEFIDGMVAIAVPVKDTLERYVASIAFHCPVQRLSVDNLVSRKDVLLEGAENLKVALFS